MSFVDEEWLVTTPVLIQNHSRGNVAVRMSRAMSLLKRHIDARVTLIRLGIGLLLSHPPKIQLVALES